MWDSIGSVVIGGVIAIISGATVEIFRLRATRATKIREENSDYREALRVAAVDFIRAARTMETHADKAVGRGREPKIAPTDWELFWNSHAILSLLLNKETLEALQIFSQVLTAAVRNENGTEPVWIRLMTPRNSFLILLRRDVREGRLENRPKKEKIQLARQARDSVRHASPLPDELGN